MKDIISYDAELFDGNNDGYLPSTLTNIDLDTPSDISTTQQMYTSINLAQLLTTTHNNTFNLHDLFPEQDTAKVLKIKLNLNQQMDSGANKNLTNDKRIIRNVTTIAPIPIFGIGTKDIA